MRTSKFTPEQILQALRQAEGGTTVVDICRKMGVTETTSYRWKKQYTGLDISELRELKQLREEDAGSRRPSRISRSTRPSSETLSKKW